MALIDCCGENGEAKEEQKEPEFLDYGTVVEKLLG